MSRQFRNVVYERSFLLTIARQQAPQAIDLYSTNLLRGGQIHSSVTGQQDSTESWRKRKHQRDELDLIMRFSRSAFRATHILTQKKDNKAITTALFYGVLLLDHWATFRVGDQPKNCALMELARCHKIYNHDAMMCMKLAIRRAVIHADLGANWERLENLDRLRDPEAKACLRTFQRRQPDNWETVSKMIIARSFEATYILDDTERSMDKMFSKFVRAGTDEMLTDREDEASHNLALVISERADQHAALIMSVAVEALEPGTMENSVQYEQMARSLQ